MYSNINGIQHVGIGVKNHEESWRWLRKYFKMDIPFFNDVALAPLMNVYTHGKTINKRAAMVVNLKGGAAMEVVSPVSFEARPADFEIQLGDIGIHICVMKSSEITATKDLFDQDGIPTSVIDETPDGKKTFFVNDPNGLVFQVVEEKEGWYKKTKYPSGGVNGIVVGVSDINASIKFYSDLLGFSNVVYDETSTFNDFSTFLPNGSGRFRRVKLQKPVVEGNFGKLGHELFIELVQAVDDYQPRKMWTGRIWGDIGFVHLGLDVKGMKKLEQKMSDGNHPFTCDTKDVLSMGDSTKVHCVYVDDPDGILIEMIEVFKIPLIEKWGIYLNLEKRNPTKPLPKWLLGLMSFMRVKD